MDLINPDLQTKALIRLKISKSKLYEAKVGVLEAQRKWDQKGSGLSHYFYIVIVPK